MESFDTWSSVPGFLHLAECCWGSSMLLQVSVLHSFFFLPPWGCIPLYAFTTSSLSICQLTGLACFQSCHQALVTSYNWVLRVITVLTLQLKCFAINLLGRVKGGFEPHQPIFKCTLCFLKTTPSFSYKPGQPLSHSSVKIPSLCAPQGFPGKGSHLPPARCCQPSSKNIPRLQRPGNRFQLSSGSVCPKRQRLISCSEEEDSPTFREWIPAWKPGSSGEALWSAYMTFDPISAFPISPYGLPLSILHPPSIPPSSVSEELSYMNYSRSIPEFCITAC